MEWKRWKQSSHKKNDPHPSIPWPEKDRDVPSIFTRSLEADWGCDGSLGP